MCLWKAMNIIAAGEVKTVILMRVCGVNLAYLEIYVAGCSCSENKLRKYVFAEFLAKWTRIFINKSEWKPEGLLEWGEGRLRKNMSDKAFTDC